MFLIEWIKKILKKEKPQKEMFTESIYLEEEAEEFHSIWDYIKFNENSQAAHISSVLGFDEWISMDEILRRIREIFRMDYKNDRSLYPYIKTLVDVGLVETNNVGGKKRWRKKDTLIKLRGKEKISVKERGKEFVGNAKS